MMEYYLFYATSIPRFMNQVLNWVLFIGIPISFLTISVMVFYMLELFRGVK